MHVEATPRIMVKVEVEASVDGEFEEAALAIEVEVEVEVLVGGGEEKTLKQYWELGRGRSASITRHIRDTEISADN